MLKLINLSTFSHDLERFNYNSEEIISFLKKNNVDGIELLNSIEWDNKVIPKTLVKGIHLKYYPIWLDFWRKDNKKLIDQFETKDNIERYYGGLSRKKIIEQYRKEIMVASFIGAKYVVFHVSHVQLEHTYTYDFTYSDCEVIDATAELVNEVFKDLKTNVKLLFENLWWPGLTFLDKSMAMRLLEKVNYKNKGFMLDTGHLMNTNISLKDEKEAIEYLTNTISKLGELKNFIKGIHLSSSLSGSYVKEQINKSKDKEKKLSYNEINKDVFIHIMNIDRHKPFKDKSISSLVDFIKPDYLIYEFITSSLEELDDYIKIQDSALES
ncbi:TIM barrel protein [Haloimpatiens sp. FM7315]|uniref:TIM barrel protein n=1 Tax=Haloimpatiens sp. FM7315 TaxID=3298609 RepID=UPI00370CF46C